MEGTIIIKDFDLFLQKSKQGINQVYQLHHQRGGVFIDASYQDKEYPSLLYKTRISIDPPRYAHSEIKWDDHKFPYELEAYKADDIEVVAPFYRPIGTLLKEFLEEVAQEVLCSREEKTKVPSHFLESCEKILKTIEKLSDVLRELRFPLNNIEWKAVDTYFGEAGIYNHLEEDVYAALSVFLYNAIREKQEKYTEVAAEANERRRRTFLEVEDKIIAKHKEALDRHNFKQGFVSA